MQLLRRSKVLNNYNTLLTKEGSRRAHTAYFWTSWNKTGCLLDPPPSKLAIASSTFLSMTAKKMPNINGKHSLMIQHRGSLPNIYKRGAWVDSMDVILCKNRLFTWVVKMDYVSAYGRQVKSIPLGNSLTLSTIKRKETTKVFKCKNSKVVLPKQDLIARPTMIKPLLIHVS